MTGVPLPGFPRLFTCDCGHLHLVNPALVHVIETLGPAVTMVTGWGAWEVPRVYAEYHQPDAGEIVLLAAVYEWPEWDPESPLSLSRKAVFWFRKDNRAARRQKMAPQPALELKTSKTTAEIVKEAGEMLGLVDVQLALTLKGWSLVEMIRDQGSRDVVLRSADDDVFIGEVNDVDEGKYVITVDLT